MGQIENKGNSCPRLIEVALPIREISAESVRDKGLPTAHISRLHKWWARRPLATARAVIFASLIPDPDDPRCPQAFRSAVEKHLKKAVPSILQFYVRGKNTITDKDPYRPYADIPDTLRNRLLTFIAKWSPVAIDFEMGNTSTKPKPAELLDDRSLVKWETSDPKNQQGREILRIAETLVKVAHDGARPSVLDPFAGGGAIPLEAGRLGCQALANDYNPVAHLILRATCEFPQKYGKPGSRKIIAENFGKIREIETKVTNVLVHDIEVWAQWMLELSKKKLTTLYLPGKDGRPVLGYLWTHTTPCANPSCKGEIPLLKSLLVVNKNDKKYLLTMNLDKSKKVVQFGVDKVKSAKAYEGSMAAKGASCPFCHQITSTEYIKKASFDGSFGERMFAAIVEGKNGKEYRAIESHEVAAFDKAVLMLNPLDVPSEAMPDSPDFVSGRGWNYSSWGNLFNARQLLVLQTLIESLHKAEEKIRNTYSDDNYSTALCLYLGLWIDRIAVFGNSMSRWRDTKEEIENPFDGQALRMMLNYPEVNPFAAVSGSAPSQLKYMLKVIEHEQLPPDARSNGCSVFLGNAGSLPHKAETVDYVITDPPYYDAIAYADLSDFFYVWLKRSVGHLFPALFSTPLTPKSEEATSLRHRHNGSQAEAQRHYEKLLSESFAESLRVVRQPKLVAVMFAHQSTEAWTALISSLFKAGLTPDATWPIATEMPKTALALGTASLETSVTVICRPRNVGSASSFKDVRKEIEKVVQESVKRFWGYGFRGADLIVACYGPAVGVFGKYERVEKADGTPVEIPELLEFARKAARDAIAGEFKGDNLSTLYYVWANLYGSAEQAWDDARMVVQIGGDADDAMQIARSHGIFVVDGSKCRLALLADRANKKGLGADPNPPLIDTLHHALLLWKEEKRSDLVAYLSERGLPDEDPFWKLAQALFEVLPHETEDWKLVHALLGERETLRTETKRGTKTGGLF